MHEKDVRLFPLNSIPARRFMSVSTAIIYNLFYIRESISQTQNDLTV